MIRRILIVIALPLVASLLLVHGAGCGESDPEASCLHCCHCGCDIGTVTIEAEDRCLDCDADCEAICQSHGGSPPESVVPCDEAG